MHLLFNRHRWISPKILPVPGGMSVIRPAVAGCVRAFAKNHIVGSRSVRDRFAIAMLELYKGKTSSKSLSSFSPFLAEVVNSALRCHFGKCRRRAREQEWI